MLKFGFHSVIFPTTWQVMWLWLIARGYLYCWKVEQDEKGRSANNKTYQVCKISVAVELSAERWNAKNQGLLYSEAEYMCIRAELILRLCKIKKHGTPLNTWLKADNGNVAAVSPWSKVSKGPNQYLWHLCKQTITAFRKVTLINMQILTRFVYFLKKMWVHAQLSTIMLRCFGLLLCGWCS